MGAAAAWLAGLQANRWNQTLELHREFNTEEMTKSRDTALAFLRNQPQKTYQQIAEEHQFDASALPVWDIMRFYQRLTVMTKHRQVVRKQVPNLGPPDIASFPN